MSLIRRLSLCLFVGGILCSPGLAQAQMGKVDTSHLTDSSFAVLRIDVKEVLKQVGKDSPNVKRIAQMLKQELLIDLHTMSAITLQVGPPVEGDEEPTLTLTIEFDQAVDQTALLKRFGRSNDFEEAEYRGKKFLKAASPYDPSVYFESKTKITMSSQAVMESILDASGMGNISSRLKALPPGCELAIVLSKTEGFDENKKQVLDLIGIPPVGLADFLDSAESAFVYFHSTSGTPFFMQAIFDDAGVAASAKSSLEGLVESGKTTVPAIKKYLNEQIEGLGDSTERFAAMQRNMMKKGLRGLDMAEVLLAGMDIQVKGKTLDVQSKHMGGIKGFGELLFFGMQEFGLGFSDVPAGPPVGPVDEAEKVLRKK